MPDENLDGLQDPSTPDGDGAPQTPAEAQPSELKPARPSTEEQLGARLRRLEEANKKVLGELAAYKAQRPSSATDSDLRQDLAVTRLVAQGYSEDEAKFVLKAGGLENPFVKAGVDAVRAKAKVEQAQVPASQVAAPVEQPRAESWNKMSLSDRKKTWDDALSRAASKRAGQPI